MLDYLDSEARTLVEAVRDFARAELAPLDRACDRDESSICQALPQLAEMGLLGLRLPEEIGGLAVDKRTYAAILHELSYASPSAAVTISVHNMCAEMTYRAGTPYARDTVAPQMVSAEHLGCFAISEADAGSDVAGVTCRAVRHDDHWMLDGNKMWITNGERGRWFLTLAQTAEFGDKRGLTMFIVDGQQPGFERIKITGKMGLRGSETVSLHLTNVQTPHESLVGEEGGGIKVGLMALNGGRITIAAQATGLAAACLDEMVSYAKQRVAFGQPIGRFAAIQQMIADSRVELAAAEALVIRACQLDELAPELISAASKAKLYATEAAGRIADRAVQVFGGAGYVNDSLVEKLYRDARVMRIYEGTSEIQRVVIARDLLKQSQAV